MRIHAPNVRAITSPEADVVVRPALAMRCPAPESRSSLGGRLLESLQQALAELLPLHQLMAK